MRTVLFVCTGNTCRSPMAESIARHLIGQGLLGVERGIFVASAGVTAANGTPPTAAAQRALEGMGLRHEGTSKPLTAPMVRNADLVLCMTADHVQSARTLAGPEAGDKVLRLDPDADIEDPIGKDQAGYDALADRLRQVIARRLEELKDRIRK